MDLYVGVEGGLTHESFEAFSWETRLLFDFFLPYSYII
jgi:hypothetical protein